jgi:Peroxisomal membrane protein (Pex16)
MQREHVVRPSSCGPQVSSLSPLSRSLLLALSLHPLHSGISHYQIYPFKSTPFFCQSVYLQPMASTGTAAAALHGTRHLVVTGTALALAPLAAADASLRAWLARRAALLGALGETLRVLAVVGPSSSYSSTSSSSSSSHDAELRAEALATLLALLRVYRDAGGLHVRDVPRALLDVARAVQLLAEMRARRRGPTTAATAAGGGGGNPASGRPWATVTLFEAAKAVLRAVLLAQGGGRLLTAAAETLPPTETPYYPCTCGMKDLPGADSVIVTRGERSGRKILRLDPARVATNRSAAAAALDLEPLFHTAYERRAAWLMRMFVPEGTCLACNPPPERPRHGTQPPPRAAPPKPEHVVAEMLYILRPLIHLMLIRRYGWRSWRAWGTSLALDLVSRQCMADPADEDDHEEQQRRMTLMLLYLVRSPFFDFVIQRILARVEAAVRRIPLVGRLTGTTLDLVRFLQRYWFYTSGT